VPTEIPEVPTGPTATDAGIGTAIAAVASAVSSVVQTAAMIKYEFAHDPCLRKTELYTQLAKAQLGVDRMTNGVNFWAAANQSAVIRAIDNWGRGTPVSAGGVSFPAYLINNRYVPNFPFAAAVLDDNLPAGPGRNEPSGVNSGTRLGAGVYIRNGELSGSRLQDAWSSWRQRMRNTVYAVGTGRPRWRERLASWVGVSRPESWRKWVPGDPVAENSAIGRAIGNVDFITTAYNEAISECATTTAWERGQGQVPLVEGLTVPFVAPEEEQKVPAGALWGLAILGGAMLWRYRG